jgi:hypothetical protein
VNESVIRQWKLEFGPEFELAGQNSTLPDSQIFPPVWWDHAALAGKGKVVANAHIIPAAHQKKH